MAKKLSITLLVTLVFATVGLLGYAQIWAKPPCEQVRIFDNRIKVVFEPGCKEVSAVYFWKGTPGDPDYDPDCDTSIDGVTCSPTNCSECPGDNCDSCWRLATKETAVMCTCEGTDCVDDTPGDPGSGLEESLARVEANESPNPPDPLWDVAVVCYLVTDTGPLSGCPIYLNPDRYFFAGGYYGR